MSHITYEQRYTISCMLKEGYSRFEIGKAIGKCKSVVSRELARNRDQRSGEYRHDLAHRKYSERKAMIPKCSRFTDQVKENIECLLNKDYSPEQVVGTLQKQGQVYVSHERIYQHVWEDKKQNGDLYTHLRRKGRSYQKAR